MRMLQPEKELQYHLEVPSQELLLFADNAVRRTEQKLSISVGEHLLVGIVIIHAPL